MNLIDRLTAATAGQSAAATAAQLGISKQAYAQARARRRLSEPAALRAAELLGIEPGAALLANATRQDPTPPVSNAAPESVCNVPTTNYANFDPHLKAVIPPACFRPIP